MDLAEEISRARVAAAAGETDALERILDEIDRETTSGGALARALVQVDREGWGQALELLEAAEPEGLDGPFALARGEALLGLDRVQEALDCFDDRLGDDPLDLDAEVGRARALFRLGRAAEAEPALRGAVARDPEHFEANYGLGVLLLQQDRLEESLQYIDRAQSLNPVHPRPYRALAVLTLALGEPGIGIEAFENLLSNPLIASPELLVDLADLYSAAGRHERLPELLRLIERVSELDPGHAVELARYWYEMDNAGEIRGLSNLFVPTHPGHLALQGLASEAEGDLPAAIEHYRAALRQAPDLWLANERLAHALLILGEPPDDVEPMVQRVEAQMAGSPEARLLRGIAQMRRGDPKGVEDVLAASNHGGLRKSLRERATWWLKEVRGE